MIFYLLLIIVSISLIVLSIYLDNKYDQTEAGEYVPVAARTTISKLIEQLEKLKVEHGDIPCAVECSFDTSSGPIDKVSVKRSSNGVKAVYLSCED